MARVVEVGFVLGVARGELAGGGGVVDPRQAGVVDHRLEVELQRGAPCNLSRLDGPAVQRTLQAGCSENALPQRESETH